MIVCLSLLLRYTAAGISHADYCKTDINKMTVQSQSCWKIVLIRPKSYHYLLTHTLLDIPEKCNAIQDNSLFIYLVIKITVWTWGEFDFFGMFNNS